MTLRSTSRNGSDFHAAPNSTQEAQATPQPDPVPHDLIDTREAAKILHCHLNAIYRWMFSGRLRGWKLGGRYKVSRADVYALFEPVKPIRLQ